MSIHLNTDFAAHEFGEEGVALRDEVLDLILVLTNSAFQTSQ